MLSALRQTLKTAWKLGYMTAEEYQKAISFRSIPEERAKASTGRSLTFKEWEKLLSVCTHEQSQIGARDAAIIALLKGHRSGTI